jgi:type VI secretion system protein ImpJ
MLLSLAVPEYRPGARNIAGRDAAGTGAAATARWRAEEHLARDETTGLAERPIQLARPNLRLLLEGETAEGYVTLPVARLRRATSGEVSLDPAFVPPLLDTAASDTLTGIARRVVDRATAKANALTGTRRQRNQGLADFSVTDVGSFWLLYTLNAYVPALRHLADVRHGHPSDLWESMVSLAGALTTFATSARVLPVYDHGRLGECFAALEALLLELIDTAVPENAVSLPLRPVSPSVQGVTLDQERLLAAPQWFLAVSAPARRPDVPMKQADVVAWVTHGFKVASADFVRDLIREQQPGLALAHVPQPPPGVPVKLDYLYFAVQRAGPAWDAVARARNLAVYSAELPDARLELVVVLK